MLLKWASTTPKEKTDKIYGRRIVDFGMVSLCREFFIRKKYVPTMAY